MLDNGVPKTLGLKDIISKYVDYQKEIIIRRTRFDLEKSEKRVHILEGLKIALDNIDEVIKIIKESKSDQIAKDKLMTRFELSEIQADSILEMKLRRLTGLERDKIENELAELLKEIERLRAILSSEKLVENIIKDELTEIKNKYSDERRTKIDMSAIEYIEDESLIPEENIVLTITNKNYIKRVNSDIYKTQNRGGVGIKGMTTNDEDFVEQIINLNTHDYILFFSNKGKVYRLKGYEIPEFSRTSKGLPIVNLLPIDKNEVINTIFVLERDTIYQHLIFATKNGIVKKTSIKDFDNIRKNGKLAINLKENDELIAVRKSQENDKILMCSSKGRMVKFSESELRIMGRSAAGVRGINLVNDNCVGLEVATDLMQALVVTEKGYGKKTIVQDYRETKRGSKGVKTLKITEKNGNIVGFKTINNDCDLMIITKNGVIIRLDVNNVSLMGRVTQGVKLINLKDNNLVTSISLIAKEES